MNSYSYSVYRNTYNGPKKRINLTVNSELVDLAKS